jgi:beta-galactosidase
MFTRIFAAIAVLVVLGLVKGASAQTYTPPASSRTVYDFNPGWKFIKQDVEGSEATEFDDSSWQDVSTPHTYNDVDSFDELIRTSGEVTIYTGPVRYRKHFKLPASAAGSKVFIEFEGMRQAAKFWVNGKAVGKHENGVTPSGIDISDAVNFGDNDNVLAVWLTNVQNYPEESSGQTFQWESRDFNPNYGGINQDVRLYVVGKVYQTLPLLDGLGTIGTYVYPTNFNLAGKSATANLESQVRNESGQPQAIEYSAVIVDAKGNTHGQIKGPTQNVGAGETAVIKASGPINDITWWSPDSPALYSVYSILSVGGKVVDVNKITTGFRKAEFKGGAGTGGVFINDKFTYLKGYAIRSINEWAAVGGAYPDWMNEFDMNLLRAGNGNYIRWMHIAAKPKNSRACDSAGIVQICPAGDKEANPPEAQWLQRVDVMRKTIVYFRNSPSILFWEAGNNGISATRMKEMVGLKNELDPHGDRAMGCRSLPATQGEDVRNPADTDRGAMAAGQSDQSIGVAEWFGVMIGQDRQTEQLQTPAQMFRAFSYQRRDAAPIIETEDYRPESARRFWDAFSPPNFEQQRGVQDQATYFVPSSEAFCLAIANRYNDYWSHRISLKDDKMARWSGYASIIWADSNQHSRMGSSAVCRVSGKVDSVRIPKQAYFVNRVLQSEKPDIHIIGHWNYPAETKKTMYVAASDADSVELFVNGASKGKVDQPKDGFIYAFPDVAFAPGSIKAVAYKAGKAVAEHELKTVGEAKSIKLTPHTGPGGFVASGSDVAFFDVEIVDAQGNRCPLDESKIDFELSGPAIWRGGVNEGIPKSINNTYLNVEAGINRVFIRSTLKPGPVTLTAKREGLPNATVTVDVKPVEIKDGLVAR